MGIRRFFYKLIRKSNYIFICISLILVFIMLMSSIIDYSKESILEMNNSLTDNYLTFNYESHNKKDDFIVKLKEIMKNHNIILKQEEGIVFQSGVSTEGLFFNGEYKNVYNILDGRFFNKDDFNVGKKLVVVGKEVLDKTKTENGKRYIYRGTDKYEVIGVIGNKDRESIWDNLLIYNVDSIFNNSLELPKNNWIIDSNKMNYKELFSFINGFNSNKEKEFVVKPREEKPNPLNEAFSENSFIIIDIVLIIVCLLFTLSKSIIFWINNLFLEVGIRKVCGATTSKIIRLLAGRYSIISIVSLCIAIAVYSLLPYLNIIESKLIKIKLNEIFLSLVTLAVIGLATIAFSIYKLSKMQLSNVIKGK